MPKLIDYPRKSFKQSLDVAEAVDHLGGTCTAPSCADKMGMQPSGHFYAIVGSAVKHNLIEAQKGNLTTTDVYKTMKHAYGENEKHKLKVSAFLSPALYLKVYERFKGKLLPIDMLGKMFIREFGVEESIAPKIAGYFIEGADACGILINGVLIDEETSVKSTSVENTAKEESKKVGDEMNEPFNGLSNMKESNDGTFTVHIVGAGLNSKLILAEAEDFIILEAMISKLKKKIK